jgi:hypothetical protein
MSQVPPPPMTSPTGYTGGYPPQQPSRGNGPAIASLVCGLFSCIPVLGSLLAIVFGFVGIRKAGQPGVGGKGMAIAGIILGVVWIGIYGASGGLILRLLQGSAAERATVKQFVGDLHAGNVDAALAQTDGSIPREQVEAVAATVQGWGTLDDVTCAALNWQGGRCTIGGVATFGGVGRPLAIELVETGKDQWKVSKLPFQDMAAPAQPTAPPDGTE